MTKDHVVFLVVPLAVLAALATFGPTGDLSLAQRWAFAALAAGVCVVGAWVRVFLDDTQHVDRTSYGWPGNPWATIVLPMTVLWAIVLFAQDDDVRIPLPVRLMVGIIASLGLAALHRLDRRNPD